MITLFSKREICVCGKLICLKVCEIILSCPLFNILCRIQFSFFLDKSSLSLYCAIWSNVQLFSLIIYLNIVKDSVCVSCITYTMCYLLNQNARTVLSVTLIFVL